MSKRIGGIVMLAFAGFVAFSVIGGIATQILLDVTHDTKSLALAAIGGIVLTNALFLFLMGAPTPLGRKLMDGIEGLRTYLTLAEKDRMNMADAPPCRRSILRHCCPMRSRSAWKNHRPYLRDWLATAAAGAAAASYAPGWYLGSNYGSFGDRIGGFSTSMANTIASTIPQPVSSSSSSFSGGGGGGSSGSGGGGGGGGGW